MKDSEDTGKEKPEESVPFSYSEQHRRECEARQVLKWPLTKRREYLAAIEKHRGKEGRKYLEEEMTRQWAIKKKPQPPAAAPAQAAPARPRAPIVLAARVPRPNLER